MRIFFAIFLSLLMLFITGPAVHADELEDIGKELEKLKATLDSSKKATATNEQQMSQLQVQLEGIKSRVNVLEGEIGKKEEEVEVGEKKLAGQKTVLDQRVISYYKNMGKSSDSFVQVLVSENLSKSLHEFFYQKSILDDDRRRIVAVVMYIKDLEDKKTKLVSERERLVPIKAEVDRQATFLAGEVAKSKKYEGEVAGKIAELSAKQQEILNAKSGGFTFNMGDGELADEYLASIKGFREQAPSGYFAIFSFGGYTHRKGMSQYGARGRAQSGQDFKTILRAYYGKEPESENTDGGINVSGYGEMNFETTYLYGIAEMPSSWHPEALKAQAVAARTYAFRYKRDGKEICTNEGCQVFNKGKSDNPPESWKKAVDETKGQILRDVVTSYASTHGGFAEPVGWDTTDGGGGGNFVDKSYDKIGGSPWLYKAWWREHYANNGDTCGLSNPWLSPQDMADIVNAAYMMKNGSSSDTGRVTPTTTSCWGGNPYSVEELRNVSAGSGGGIGSVSGVSVSQGNGNTNEVIFQTDKGEKRLSAADFKKGVSLRAPGYIRIPQAGFAFFNIERK